MDIKDAISSIPTSALDSIKSAVLSLIGCTSASIRFCCPGVIKSYDTRSKNAKVLPIVKYAYTNSKGEVSYVDRDELTLHVLDYTYGAGTIKWPYFAGDTGLIIACDFDISELETEKGNLFDNNNRVDLDEYIKELGITEQGFTLDTFQKAVIGLASTAQTHEHGHGFFIPCSFTDFSANKNKDLILDDDNYTEEDKKIYFGTTIDEKEYPSKKSCHMSITNGEGKENPSKILFAASSEDGTKTNVSFQNDKLTVMNGKKKDDKKLVKLTLDYVEDFSFSLEDKNPIERKIYVDKDGTLEISGKALYTLSHKDETTSIKFKKEVIKTKATGGKLYPSSAFSITHAKEALNIKIKGTVIKLSPNSIFTVPSKIKADTVLLSADKLIINTGSLTSSVSTGISGDVDCPGKCKGHDDEE